MEINIAPADICAALYRKAIGSKVLDGKHAAFLRLLANEIAAFRFPENGQGKLLLPEAANNMVGCGVASRHGLREDDYVARRYRNRVSLFAHRSWAAETSTVHAIVYTLAAYLKDPDVTAQEAEAVRANGEPTHVLVALLASPGQNPAYPGRVLVHNIAGGNNEFVPRTHPFKRNTTAFPILEFNNREAVEHDLTMLHRWIELAAASEEFDNEWVTVAD